MSDPTPHPGLRHMLPGDAGKYLDMLVAAAEKEPPWTAGHQIAGKLRAALAAVPAVQPDGECRETGETLQSGGEIARQPDSGLRDKVVALRESRFRWAEEAAETAAQRAALWELCKKITRFAVIERCKTCHDDAKELETLRASAIVLPEDWQQQLADGDYPEQVIELINSWRLATLGERGRANSPTR